MNPGGHVGIAINIKNSNINNGFNRLTVKSNPKNPKERIRFRVSAPTHSFVGRDELINKIKKHLDLASDTSEEGASHVLSCIRVICGLGGVGKTETAREFIRRYDQEFEHVIWIDAETSTSMIRDFTCVADNDFRVELTKDDDTQRAIEDIVREVYELACRGNKTSLFVFDNAEDMDDSVLDGMNLDGIRQFLPQSIPSHFIPPRFLVTSRNQLWNEVMVLSLEEFTKEEALAFLEKVLEKTFPSLRVEQLSDSEELVEMLGKLPLALEEAAAYIKLENVMRVASIRDPFYIRDYIELHNQEARRLLQKNLVRGYKNPIYITWNITVAKITANSDGGRLALRMLKLISYLSPDNIPKDVILHLVQDDRQDANIALYLLSKYALIKPNEGNCSYSIHRLVQQVTREHSKEDGEEEKLLGSIMESLISYQSASLHMEKNTRPKQSFVDNVVVFSGYLNGRSYMTELGTKSMNFMVATATRLHNGGKYDAALKLYDIINMALTVDQTDDEDMRKSMAVFQLEVENNIGVALYEMGELDKSIPILESVVEKRGELLGPAHADTIAAWTNLAIVFSVKGNVKKAMEIHKKISNLSADNLNPEDPQYFVARMNLAKILRNEGNLPEALKVLEEIAEKRTEFFGADHNDTLKARSLVANLKFNLGRKQEALMIYRDINARRASVGGSLDGDYLQSLLSMAAILEDVDNYEEAFPIFEQVFKGFTEIHGPDHHLTLAAQSNMAKNLDHQGQYPQALVVHEQIYQKQKSKFLPNHTSVISSLDNIAKMHYKLDQFDQALKLYQEALQLRESKAEEDPDIPATQHSIALVLRRQGKIDEALKMYEIVYENRIYLRGKDHPDTIQAKVNVANILYDKGDFEKALEVYQDIEKLQEKVLGSAHPDTIETRKCIEKISSNLEDYKKQLEVKVTGGWWKKLTGQSGKILGANNPKRLTVLVRRSSTLRQKGQHDHAMFLLNEVRSVVDRADEPSSPNTCKALNNMGNILLSQGKFNEAYSLHQKVLEIREKDSPINHSLILSSKNNLANTLMEMGKSEEAVKIFKEVAKKRGKLHGQDDPGTINALKNLASALIDQRRYDEAEKVIHDVVQKLSKKDGSQGPEALAAKNILAVIFRMKGQPDHAMTILDEVVQLQEAVLNPNHPELLDSLNNKANVLRQLGRLNEAYKLHERVAEQRKLLYGPFHPDTMSSYSNLANVILEEGNLDEAFRLHDNVLNNRKEALGSDHPDTLSSMFNKAAVLARQGKLAESAEILQKVVRKRKQLLGPFHPDTVTAVERLEVLLAADFDKEEAALATDSSSST